MGQQRKRHKKGKKENIKIKQDNSVTNDKIVSKSIFSNNVNTYDCISYSYTHYHATYNNKI